MQKMHRSNREAQDSQNAVRRHNENTSAAPPLDTVEPWKFGFFILLQFLIYLDRGILPGCIGAMNKFITSSLPTKTPDFYLGILQSIFVVGLSISCPIMAHFSHRYDHGKLIAAGLGLWALGELLAWVASQTTGYLCMVAARVLSGVGEASLLSLVPPLILQYAQSHAGVILGVFCAIIPVGTAVGFCYGSFINTHVGGWGNAYLIEGLVALPLVIACASLRLPRPKESDVYANDEDRIDSGIDSGTKSKINPLDKTSAANTIAFQPRCRTHINNEQQSNDNSGSTTGSSTTAVAYSAYAASVACFSTFGAAFIVNLDLLKSEEAASWAMGALVGIAGILGSLSGGALTSYVTRYQTEVHLFEEVVARMRKVVALLQRTLQRIVIWLPGMAHSSLWSTSSQIPRRPEPRATSSLSKPATQAPRGISPRILRMSSSSSTTGDYDRKASLELRCLMRTILPLLYISIAMFVLGCLASSWVTFAVAVGCGLVGLFAAQVALNMGAMLAVPMQYRSCAVATVTLLLHATGDVPAPLIVGLLKDTLAPHCGLGDHPPLSPSPNYSQPTPQSLIRGFLTVPLKATENTCEDEQGGVRATELIVAGWLLWVIFGVWKAMKSAEKKQTSHMETPLLLETR